MKCKTMIPFDDNKFKDDNDDAICEKWPHYLFVYQKFIKGKTL